MTTGTTIELRRGPGDGERRKVKFEDFVRTKSGVWCIVIKLAQHPTQNALYSIGTQDPRDCSPVDIYDAMWVGWIADFTAAPNTDTEDATGC